MSGSSGDDAGTGDDAGCPDVESEEKFTVFRDYDVCGNRVLGPLGGNLMPSSASPAFPRDAQFVDQIGGISSVLSLPGSESSKSLCTSLEFAKDDEEHNAQIVDPFRKDHYDALESLRELLCQVYSPRSVEVHVAEAKAYSESYLRERAAGSSRRIQSDKLV